MKMTFDILSGSKHFKNLRNVKMDFSTQLNRGGNIVMKDISEGIGFGRDINGKPFKKLSPNTVASKRAKGSPTPRTALSDEGVMKNTYIKKRASRHSQECIVTAPKSRAKIGQYHQQGTAPYTIVPKKAKLLSFVTQEGRVFAKKVNHPGLPKREWFGISQKAQDKIVKAMMEEIDAIIRRI